MESKEIVVNVTEKTKHMKSFIKKVIPEWMLFLYRSYKPSKLKTAVIRYLKSIPNKTEDEQDILRFLKRNAMCLWPYTYTRTYRAKNVVVCCDVEKNMHYVLYDNKRLYFKKGWTKKQVQEYYRTILIEQDIRSPHRYESQTFFVSAGDVVVDAGAAEGIFALSVIEKAKKIYLFEVDEEWVEALNATFAPWKDKVVIVNKYISDNDNNNCIKLDTYFNSDKVDFIKADIEGAESQLLAGAKILLRSPLKMALCTYHRQSDAENFSQILTENGFKTEFSKGYVLPVWDISQPPYLRRCLIRAKK